MNYTELKQEVQDFTHRQDLTPKMDIFCQLSEAMINKDLRVLEMETRLDTTFTDTYVDLPDDFLEIRALHIESAGARIPLPQVTPQQLDQRYSRVTGRPRAYAVHGGQFEFRPGIEVANPYNGEISYFNSVATLVTNPTNDVLTKYPLLYLSAMLVQAYSYVQDNEEMQKWGSVYAEQVRQANKQAIGGRYLVPSIGV